MTSWLNWLLYCAITQARRPSKHAVFSFGEADMGGVQMQKNAPSCLQSSVGITPRGRIQNWSKVVDEIFSSSVFMIMFVIIDTYLE